MPLFWAPIGGQAEVDRVRDDGYGDLCTDSWLSFDEVSVDGNKLLAAFCLMLDCVGHRLIRLRDLLHVEWSSTSRRESDPNK